MAADNYFAFVLAILFAYKTSTFFQHSHLFALGIYDFFSILLVIIPFIFTYSSAGSFGPRRYYDYGDVLNQFKALNNMSGIISITLLLLIFVQLTYFINLFIGIYKKEAFAKHDNKMGRLQVA